MSVKKTVEDYMQMPYSLTIKRVNDESGTYFYGNIVELPGCQSTGETIEELLTNIKRALEGYLEAKIRRGLPIPEPNE